MRSARRLPLAVAVAGLLAVFAFSAAPAGAKVVTDPTIHRNFGIVPTVFAKPPPARAACLADGSDCTLLGYHNGPVQHGEKLYLLFWTPTGHAAPAAYRTGMANWLTQMSSLSYSPSGPISVTEQYYDLTNPSSAKNFVSYSVSNKGSLVDTDAYPASGCPAYTDAAICLTDAQLQTELAKYVSAHNLPTGMGVEYFILTPSNVGSCFDSGGSQCAYTAYCGYHNNFTSSGKTILYANMPWAYNVNGCDVNLAFGAGYPNSDQIDSVVGIFSHELSETMTDPIVNPSATGWWQNGSATDAGYEIGDKCAYIYGSGGYGSMSGLNNNGGGYYNYTIGPHDYLMQIEFSNANATCITHNSFTVQPTMTAATPTRATHGVSTTFSETVTDANGVAYVDFYWGDGTVSRSFTCTGTSPTFTCTAKHNFATAGNRTLTGVATDKKGSTKKVNTAIVVS